MLSRIRRALADKEQGFTLIELLVVIIIIGILAAIAIPVFLNQRKKAVDASLKSDLHHASVILEAWLIDNPGLPFPGGEIATPPGPTDGAMGGLKVSAGNTISLWPSATRGGYCLYARNLNASKAVDSLHTMKWRSLAGGLDPNLATVSSPCVD